MTEQLKPCPFCEGINVIHSGYRMYCHACGAEGPDADSADESAAIAAWNCRAQPAQAGAEPVSWVVLQKTADEIVRSKSLWKRFIDGTPLENDIACWMADFAEQFSSHPPARVPLTDEEIALALGFGEFTTESTKVTLTAVARAIEAAHGIGGGK